MPVLAIIPPMSQKSTRPIAVDLFAGAGGMSLGFERAGFDVLAAVEIDPVHAAIHRFNFPECAVVPLSVTDVTGDLIRSRSKIQNRPIDVVIGGAPCQGFSMIGQRAIDDPRNFLVREFVRIVRELDAKYFVFENVKGLTVGKHRAFLSELIQEFEDAGYSVRRDWRVLNAADFGVPQDRHRLFLMGCKKGLPLPSYPEPSTQGQRVTCKDALADLPNVEKFKQLLDADWVKCTASKAKSEFGSLMRSETSSAWAFGYQRSWDRNLLTCSSRTFHSDITRTRFAETLPGEVEPISRFFKLSAKGISNTLRAGTDSARGAFTSPRPIHYKWPRCVTVREMARLHSFPDWFRFNATKWHGARQIGNAVPPLLAQAVATSVCAALSCRPTRPKRVLRLEESWLLGLSVAEAADLWGIRNPIAQRNMKSGAKKRRQSETV